MNLNIVKKTGMYPNFGNSSVIKKDKQSDLDNHKEAESPISKKGEKIILFSGAFLSAAGVIIKGCCNVAADDTDGSVSKWFKKFINNIIDRRHPNVKGKERNRMFLGTSLLVLGLFIVGGAIIHVITKAPRLNYEGNINAFKKSKEMDAYIKGNSAEIELYNQMNERAKSTFDPNERQNLYSSYMLLQNAKNIPPSWTNVK